MKVGILAVQGAFAEHAKIVAQLGGEYVLIRKKENITHDIDRLILPGGESTVQSKLIKELDMFDILNKKISDGMLVLATCAGIILLSEKCTDNSVECFRTLPVTVRRNAYGRQLGSFSAVGNVGDIKDFPMRFIRAPYIESVNCSKNEIEILNVTDGNITAVQYKNQTALSFHPELTDDFRIHEMFLKMK